MWDIQILGLDFFDIFYNFIIYSFLGWIYESTFVSITKKSWVNRGFLNGPIIPIYGAGATMVYIVFWRYRNQYLLIFTGGMVLATLLEYITSLLMEQLFHAKWWDYSDKKFNVNGRICLAASLFWGVLSLIMTELLQPAMVKLLDAIPKEYGTYAGYVIITLLLSDTTVTVVHTLKLDRVLSDLQRLKTDFQDYIEKSRIYETKEELKRRLSVYKASELLDGIKSFMEDNRDKLIERNMTKDGFEFKKLRLEIEGHVKEYLNRLQVRESKTSFVQRRLLKAFPDMRSMRHEVELTSLKERFIKSIKKERWCNMSNILSDDLKGTSKSYLSGFLRVALVGILVLIQFVLLFLLTYWLSASTIYIYMIIEIFSIFVTIGLVNDNRSPSYKIGWICIVLILPLTGHIMYALWGKAGSKKKIEKQVLAKLNHGYQYLHYDSDLAVEYALKYPTKSRISRYMESQHFPLFKNNQIQYYPMGEDTFEAIFEDIKNAKKFILINFFIVGEGVLWDNMHKLLLQKIKEGIRVKFMYDDFGATLRTPKNFRKNLEAEGFEIAVFNPIHKYTDKLYMNYRSHQKIIVIDGNIGYTGGMNLADEYVNLVKRFGTWKDNAVRVAGDAVWGLTVTFLQMWEICNNNTRIDYDTYRPTMKFEPSDVYCHVISDGPANNPNNPIETVYMQIINYAKKYVYITTPYLIIEDDMKQALITAVKSGIDVRIITPYIPDKKNVKRLTNYNYGQLLEAGVKIYEYKPGFIHAKTIINEDCGIVGTINMDYRSFYLHYECGLWMCNRQAIDVIKDDLLDTMDISLLITYQDWKNRPWYLKTYQRILNLFSTLM
ncbi:cardiolipin synthase [Anaerocolumna sp. AGMB13025]|uniref:cardiolipin synthase n=1 Tax=Anaerocolumna sp. AGMB13025 TaxID=3039116 RepID=UPI00241CFCF9|nr:cardiolipin synthase [Anaerocolumna sp. AGMB13025]WFR59875.1 cardiolipin synthase [Anaerocolumna sp. AGMB13025]